MEQEPLHSCVSDGLRSRDQGGMGGRGSLEPTVTPGFQLWGGCVQDEREKGHRWLSTKVRCSFCLPAEPPCCADTPLSRLWKTSPALQLEGGALLI